MISPKITIPPVEPVSQEEIERRRKVVHDILELRKKIGPIGMSTADLLEYPWDEDEEDD